MSYLEKLDKNINPDLTRAWLDLAWYDNGVMFEEATVS